MWLVVVGSVFLFQENKFGLDVFLFFYFFEQMKKYLLMLLLWLLLYEGLDYLVGYILFTSFYCTSAEIYAWKIDLYNSSLVCQIVYLK